MSKEQRARPVRGAEGEAAHPEREEEEEEAAGEGEHRPR